MLMQRARVNSSLSGFKVNNGGVEVTHLQFADVTLFLCDRDVEQIRTLRQSLMTQHESECTEQTTSTSD